MAPKLSIDDLTYMVLYIGFYLNRITFVVEILWESSEIGED